ncbi:MAG: FAD-dependent oxidoreductase [Thermodesulfobacteriota bacterium]
MKKIRVPEDLTVLAHAVKDRKAKEKRVIKICCTTGCRAGGSLKIIEAMQAELTAQGLADQIVIKKTGCRGFCEKGPVMNIEPEDIFYNQVEPRDVPDIVNLTVKRGEQVPRLLYTDPDTRAPIPRERDIPFFSKQVRRVLSNCGQIDPTDIEDYIAAGGYQALVKALTRMRPDEIIEEVIAARLRGRGGAGFPTGQKWRFAREAEGKPKYIICNADEGDPGAFMDRAVLEGDPHAVLEGMLIGAYAIGAEYGYVYVREEYPIAIDHLTIAIRQMESLGLLGEDIMGTGFRFHLGLKKGAGAFVCGEETALMASIEGQRGMPRARPPFPAQAGLAGKPTNINNVETWANIPLIINHGAAWYGEVGTEKSKGTKIFSLVGKVNNTGLVEVPMGVSIREVVFDIGGGIPKGRKFKAVQMGGPSGGCVPANYLNIPIDYDTLQRIGAIMGSGGMVVMDENNCMVEIARFFLEFTQSESCGKCAPCRLGTTQLLKILTRITRGQGNPTDLDRIREIGATVTETSLCGLGQTCAKPAISTLRYFAKEYEDHIREHRCSGAVCDAMVISACQHACPAGIDVPNYVAAVARGQYRQAVEIIRERNPFPAVCGRICIHPCETKCRRGELDDPVAIRSLKRFAADWYFEHIGPERNPFPVTRKQTVAVVGAGPAGLTCGYFLAKSGYKVTVFESQDRGGGMLGIAVPEFRLPRRIIEQEIAYIANCGVDIRYNAPIDAKHTVNDLMAEGYGAVFIAAGAQASMRMGIAGEGEGVTGLHYGLQFLTAVRTGKSVPLGGKVLVIGGGNVALDAARTALRMGAEDVQIYYRRSVQEMPAWVKDIEEAEEEGITIHPMWAPKSILRNNGRVAGMEFARSKTVYDADGRSRLSLDETEIRQVEAGAVIIAIGQAPDISFLSKDSQIERSLWGSLEVDANRLSTNVPGIFAGGDFTTGPSTVISAIASGRRAAIAVHRFLSGDTGRITIIDEKTRTPVDAGLALEEESAAEKPRIQVELEQPRERVRDFREVEKGFVSAEEAGREAYRCLRCDLEKERR